METYFITILYCAAVVCQALESANTVGYAPINDGGNKNPGIGGLFIPVSGGSTYKLSSITVSGDGDYMDPEVEYLQMLNPNGSAVIARYTYVSEAFLRDAFGDEDWADYAGAIGWWNRFSGIVDAIENADYTNKLDGNKDPDITVGTAFLGLLLGSELNFTSSGEVPGISTAFNDDGNKNPFFLNYLPVSIDLTAITVSSEGGDYMDPEVEYLQVLNPNGSAVTARYTYVSEAFLRDAFGDEDWADYAGAIGWWNRFSGIVDAIENADYTNKIAVGDVVLDPGASFLGLLLGSGLDFNFPSAIPQE